MIFSRILRIARISISRLPHEIAYAEWATSTLSKMQIVDEVQFALKKLPLFVYPSASTPLLVIPSPSSEPSHRPSSIYPHLPSETLPSNIPHHSCTKTHKPFSSHKRKQPPSSSPQNPTKKPNHLPLNPPPKKKLLDFWLRLLSSLLEKSPSPNRLSNVSKRSLPQPSALVWAPTLMTSNNAWTQLLQRLRKCILCKHLLMTMMG